MNREMIYVGSGSGKSMLAQNLGGITDLSVIHIDPKYWKPDCPERFTGNSNCVGRRLLPS